MADVDCIGTSQYKRRKNGELVDLHITSFGWDAAHTGICIKWFSEQIGWGEYYISFNEEKQTIFVDSECMDAADDMSFLKALFEALPKSGMD